MSSHTTSRDDAPARGSPVAAPARAVALDALRGIALFGVLVVNLLTEFRVSIFEQFLPPAEGVTESPLDHAIATVVRVGFESKAFIVFSLLFGVGLAAQQERSDAKSRHFPRYVARRLSMLLAIGLGHMFLVWNGDILTLYAVLGVLAAMLLRFSTRVLVLLAFALFALHVAALSYYPRAFANLEAMTAHVAAARRIYSNGSFAQVLAFRVQEVRPIAALLVWSAPRTLALFLLGASAWRSRFFVPGERRRPLLAIAALGLGIGFSCEMTVNEIALTFGAIALALGYSAAVLVAFGQPQLARGLAVFAPLGRMALTSYLTQSLVLSAIFYGWGLGLFGRLDETSALAIGIVLFVAQAVFSALWLRRYAFGPVEWLWRSFTYAAWQPLRR